MKKFYKWWKKASQGNINEYHAYEGWKAALKCVRDEMLPNCHEPMDIHNFIEEELG